MPSIVRSCGYCGAPLNEKGEQVYPVPNDYDPNNYPHDVCKPCGNQMNYEESQRYVTHEMALDAGDPSLEGMPL